ncbi:MAG: hypothetical protein AB7S50_10185 [Bacteroidales bacterium]
MNLNLKIITNIIIALLGMVFLYVLFVFFNSKQIDSIEDQKGCLFEKQILEIVLKTNILYEGVKLNNINVLDRDGHSHNLKYFLDTMPGLFLYVPFEGCNKCVEDIIDLMKKYSKLESNNVKVFLLIKSPNFRSFLANQIEEECNIKSLYIKEGWLGLDIEKLDTPFLFITDKKLFADKFFLIDKNIKDINRFYIENIFSNF